jgi:hypothetical protein
MYLAAIEQLLFVPRVAHATPWQPACCRIVHFIFDNAGKIRQLRIFFDEGCAF